jgi:hypothetical protein
VESYKLRYFNLFELFDYFGDGEPLTVHETPLGVENLSF